MLSQGEPRDAAVNFDTHRIVRAVFPATAKVSFWSQKGAPIGQSLPENVERQRNIFWPVYPFYNVLQVATFKSIYTWWSATICQACRGLCTPDCEIDFFLNRALSGIFNPALLENEAWIHLLRQNSTWRDVELSRVMLLFVYYYARSSQRIIKHEIGNNKKA